MRKFLAVCTCLILFSFLLVSRENVYSRQADNTRRLYADDRILIKFKADVEPALDIDLMAGEIIGAPARAEALTTDRSGGMQLIRFDKSVGVEEAVRRAQQDPRVQYAEPDYFVYAMDTIPNDPFFSQMWGLSNVGSQTSNIDAPRAWDITTGIDDVVAVVLDTGVDLQHEDLAANAWSNPREIAGNGIDDDGNGFIDDLVGWNFFDGTNQPFKSYTEDSHGTHVAGTIGAAGNNAKGVTGVAWHVRIMSLKFLGGSNGNGSTSNAVRGINYAIDMRNRGVNVRVINASWGGRSDSQSLRDAIAAANSAGILFVCAAGNGDSQTNGLGWNIDETPEYPGVYASDFPNVISVAAVNQDGSLPSFSNYGHGSVSLAAPGVSILSTLPLGNYGSASGTSMATPHVSGIAVLLWSRDFSLTPAQVKQRIVDTSDPLPSLVSLVARSGRANAYDALISRIAPPQSPVVFAPVQLSKKVVTIDGFGFVNGSAIVEVDGTPLPAADYDSSFALANGTLTRLSVYLGKKPLRRTFPSGVPVSVDVFNPTTGERSPSITVTRF